MRVYKDLKSQNKIVCKYAIYKSQHIIEIRDHRQANACNINGLKIVPDLQAICKWVAITQK